MTASGGFLSREPQGVLADRTQPTTEKSWGQYATPTHVADFMVQLISKDKSATILDPCAGKGVFAQSLHRHGFGVVEQIELDPSLCKATPGVRLGDFLLGDFSQHYDVIIGNPPYVRWRNIPASYRRLLMSSPHWAGRLSTLGDLLHPFILRGAELVREGGELIFIAPVFWMQTLHAAGLRRELSAMGHLSTLILLGEAKVFPGVASTIAIFVFVKRRSKNPIKVIDLQSRTMILGSELAAALRLLKELHTNKHSVETEGAFAYLHPQFTGGGVWRPLPPHARRRVETIETQCVRNAPLVSYHSGGDTHRARITSLFEREDLEAFDIPDSERRRVSLDRRTYYILSSGRGTLVDYDVGAANGARDPRTFTRYVRLGDVVDIGNGLVSGLDAAFVVRDRARLTLREEQILVRVVKARCLRRGFFENPVEYFLPNSISTEDELQRDYPSVWASLSPYRKELEARYSYSKTIPWWHWVFMRNFKLISQATEILVTPCKERFNRRGYLRFAFVPHGYIVTQDVTAMVRKPFVREDLKYLLAWLLSEQVYDWVNSKGFSRGGVQEFSEEPLRRIPVRLVDWSNKEEVQAHHRIVSEMTALIHSHSEQPFLERVQQVLDTLVKPPLDDYLV